MSFASASTNVPAIGNTSGSAFAAIHNLETTIMASKSTLPNYVQSALVADRKAQVTTVASIAVYTFGELKAGREVSELAKRLAQVGTHRAETTWANYATVCNAVATSLKIAPKLESLFAEQADIDSAAGIADVASAFAVWLESSLKAKGFTSNIDDVKRFATNKISLKAQKIADEAAAEEQRKAKEAQDAAEAEARAKQAADAASNLTPVDGTPVEGAHNPGDIPNTGHEPVEGAPVEGYPDAIKPMMESVVRVTRAAGMLDIVVEESASDDEIMSIIEALQSELDRRTAPVETESQESVEA